MMDVAQLLQQSLSADNATRSQAEQSLAQTARDSPSVYLVSMCHHLASENASQSTRNAAGLQLKNQLSARDPSLRNQKAQLWLEFVDVVARQEIKRNVLATLRSQDSRAGQSAAQVIAAIAGIELPLSQWPELIDTLLNNVTNEKSPSQLKRATLESIGFICEEIDPQILASQSNHILTAIVQGARKEEPSAEVRLAAVKALNNSIEFARDNFDRQHERDFIMQVVCEATQSENTQVSLAAFECLVKIMHEYYEYMESYMNNGLYQLTTLSMKSSNPDIVLQAIEFWSTICEEESYRLDEGASVCNFAAGAQHEIAPTLLVLLAKQDETDDEDDWNVSMAAATCLSLLAMCVGNRIIDSSTRVIPFIESNITHSDWRYREAAAMAFGSILQGPEPHVLGDFVRQALPLLLNMTKDTALPVKDTAAWTVSRICELHNDAIDENMVPMLIATLLDGLRQHPRVASHCTWAVMQYTASCGSLGDENSSNVLSPAFRELASALIQTADRADSHESNLRAGAYEALSSLISYSANDTADQVLQLTQLMVDRLRSTVSHEKLSKDVLTGYAEIQGYLAAVLQSAARKLGSRVNPFADDIMLLFLQIFNSGAAVKSASLIEEIFMAIGALTSALDKDFARYMEAFAPFLYTALSNHEEYQLCTVSVGLVGDISRAIGDLILPYCDTIVSLLLQNLSNATINRSVKPPLLSAFGDIALAVEGEFEKYLPHAMAMLIGASQLVPTSDSFDELDFIAQLRESIFESLAAIVQGLKSRDKAALLGPYLESILAFIQVVSQDDQRGDSETRGAVGLLGDLADALGLQIAPLLRNTPWITQFVSVVVQSGDVSDQTKTLAVWSLKTIQKAIRS